MKETWYSYLRDEAEKKRQSQKKKEKRKNRVNTKAFRTAQSFGPADKGNEDKNE
jgi:hypothetical protein